jgi:hypothetical protein
MEGLLRGHGGRRGTFSAAWRLKGMLKSTMGDGGIGKA